MPGATPPPPSLQSQVNASQGRQPIKQRSNVVLWLWMVFSVAALLCFLLTQAIVGAAAGAVLVMWVPLLIGIGLLLVAGVFAVIGTVSFLRRPSRGAAILFSCGWCAGIGSVWSLTKALSAMWAGAKATALFGAAVLAMSPWGLFTLCLVGSLLQAERDKMQNSLQPEWRMIQVDFLDTDPSNSTQSISFKLTNTGPHAIARMEGDLLVWDSTQCAKIELTVNPKEPLKAGETISLNFPLDEKGKQVLDIIKRVDSDDGQREGAATQATGHEFHLRYQLRRLTSQDGHAFEIRSGNIEPSKTAPDYSFRRGLTNAEWRLIKVKYLGTQTAEHHGRAAFELKMPDNYRVAQLKGRLYIMDIEEGHVEKEVQLNPEGAMAEGETVMFALDAGKESESADKIITSRRAYDRAIINEEQTSCIFRFQLQTMKTADGKVHAIDWLGNLKDE